MGSSASGRRRSHHQFLFSLHAQYILFVLVNAFELSFLQSTEFRTISSDQILALTPIAVLLPNGSKLDMVDDRGRAEATPRSKQKTTRDKKHYMRNKTQNSNSFAGYFEATTWIELTAMISSLKEHCKPDLRLCEFFLLYTLCLIYCPQSFSGGGLYSSGNGLLLIVYDWLL